MFNKNYTPNEDFWRTVRMKVVAWVSSQVFDRPFSFEPDPFEATLITDENTEEGQAALHNQIYCES